MDLGIRGKRALVCGASKGLGLGCARALAEAGVDLVMNARGAEALSEAAAAIRADFGVGVETVAADVTSDEGRSAVLALGAVAAQVGTAYLSCPEATTSAVHRAALRTPEARLTALTNVFTGRPARGVVNRLMREIGPMNAAAPAFPLASGAIMPLRTRAEARGSGDFTGLWAGQHIRQGPDLPAGRLTRDLI